MLICICGRRSFLAKVPAELAMALLLVFSTVVAYVVVDAAVPLPREGSRLLIRGLRADVRGDLVRGLSYLPLLCGTWWLAASIKSPRRSVRLFFAVVGFLSLTHVVQALLILALCPGSLTGSSLGFRWESRDAYSAAGLDAWATALSVVVAWGVWRYRRAAGTSDAG